MGQVFTRKCNKNNNNVSPQHVTQIPSDPVDVNNIPNQPSSDLSTSLPRDDSPASTTAISCIDTNLELCCNILQSMEQESNALNPVDKSTDSLQELHTKIAAMSAALRKIENVINVSANIDEHPAEGIDTNNITQTPLSSSSTYSLSPPQADMNEDEEEEEDALIQQQHEGMTAGRDMLMGQAYGPLAFNPPSIVVAAKRDELERADSEQYQLCAKSHSTDNHVIAVNEAPLPSMEEVHDEETEKAESDIDFLAVHDEEESVGSPRLLQIPYMEQLAFPIRRKSVDYGEVSCCSLVEDDESLFSASSSELMDREHLIDEIKPARKDYKVIPSSDEEEGAAQSSENEVHILNNAEDAKRDELPQDEEDENEHEYIASQAAPEISMEIYSEYERFLDGILNATTAAKQHGGTHNQSGSNRPVPSQQQTNAHNSTHCVWSGPGHFHPGGGHPGDDEDDDDEKKGNDGNHNYNGPVLAYAYYACHGCMVRDQMIMGQAGLIVKSSQTINVLMDKIKRLSTSAHNASSPVPSALLASPVPAPFPPVPVAVNEPLSVHIPSEQVQPGKPVRKKKKKKQKMKKKKSVDVGFRRNQQQQSSYDPPALFRAQSNIQIQRAFTENVVPNRIREEFTDLYQYMDKAVAFNHVHIDNDDDDECNEDQKNDDEEEEVKMVDLDFHDRVTGERLYGVVKPHRHKGFRWRMEPRLYTANELNTTYHISPNDSPPLFSRPVVIDEHQQQIRTRLHEPLGRTKWSKVKIFAPQRDKNTKQRMTLSVIKQVFVRTLTECVTRLQREKQLNLIPIVMFSGNAKENRHWVEYVQIVRFCGNVDIGVSFVYDEEKDAVFVSGIHLDRDAILRQHELLLPGHGKECRCLDGFVSNISDLKIGNLDEDLNRIKDLHAKCVKYEETIQELEANAMLQDSPSASSSAASMSADHSFGVISNTSSCIE